MYLPMYVMYVHRWVPTRTYPTFTFKRIGYVTKSPLSEHTKDGLPFSAVYVEPFSDKHYSVRTS